MDPATKVKAMASELVTISQDQILESLDCLLNEQLILVAKQPMSELNSKIEWFFRSKELLPSNFKTSQFILKQSNQKKWALGVIGSQFKSSVPERLLNLIISTSDELIMNAFFDAPVLDGKVLYKNTARTNIVKTDHPVEVILGESEDEIAISVIDFYGSVNMNSIIKHLKKSFQKENYTAPKGEGAGLGLSLSIKRNTSLLIKVTPGVSSQFVIIFPKTKNYKSYLEKSQLIGLISTK